MPTGEVVDWIFRGLFAVLVILWGRTQKQGDALVVQRADALKRLVDHDRRALEVLMESKMASLQTVANERSHALDRLFESQFALRDQQIDALRQLTERAADRFSKEGGRITEKIEEHRDRLTLLESGHKQMHELILQLKPL